MTMDRFRLDGRLALVTGGGRGLGRLDVVVHAAGNQVRKPALVGSMTSAWVSLPGGTGQVLAVDGGWTVA